ncbi:YpoC family protein [Shouchella patagoniensis]|uniref:YpoC family protein n=1 Tax=Shouchella patagoniensis TaxID=228576 RepID=UPI000994EEE8|nr:hypothetical protein [Shouchella patagoniensis]
MRKQVPKMLLCLPFYKPESSVTISSSATFIERQWQVPFAEEISYQSEPWQEPHEYIRELCLFFHQQKEELSVSYRHRQPQEESLLKSKALMLQCLFWINQEPVNLVSLKEKINHFAVLPNNALERVIFVLENNNYVSFLQMCALFEELEKLNARIQVRNTLIKQRGRR